jgi:hypothetical protein
MIVKKACSRGADFCVMLLISLSVMSSFFMAQPSGFGNIPLCLG